MIVNTKCWGDQPQRFKSTAGLQKIVAPKGAVLQTPAEVSDTEDIEGVLDFIASQEIGISLLCDYAPFITPYGQEDPSLVRRSRKKR